MSANGSARGSQKFSYHKQATQLPTSLCWGNTLSDNTLDQLNKNTERKHDHTWVLQVILYGLIADSLDLIADSLDYSTHQSR